MLVGVESLHFTRFVREFAVLSFLLQSDSSVSRVEMPKGKGKFVNHKGKHRSFTNPDELEEQRKREEKERQWRAERGEVSSSEEEEEEEKKKGSDESSSEEETSSEEEDEGKAKGVEGLIQVENPNRVQQKAKKLSTLNTELAAAPSSSKPELSRREREELEKQRAAANYQRLHAKGKTEEARADLARLAIIKAQREEAAKKREAEAKMKEVEKQKKTQQTKQALGKKP